MTRIARCLFRILLPLTIAGAVPAAAADYPTKPVRLTIPFPPGGASDILARLVAEQLTAVLKERVLVDNRPGAGGLIAIKAVVDTAPDGHSLLQIATSFVINPSLYKKLPYDPEKSFVPITPLAIADNILVVHPSLPVRSVSGFVAFARKHPGELNYAHTGFGTQAYLAAELFRQAAGVKIVPVAYKGTPAALLDVISGQIHVMFAGAPPALPHVKSGRLRAVAATGKERLAELADVPTVGETIPGFEAAVWYGLLAPAGTPEAIVARLNAAAAEGFSRAGVRARLAQVGFRPMHGSPAEFAAFMRNEGSKWSKVIAESGTTIRN